MIERALWDAVVVGLDVAGKRCFKFGSGFEPRLPDDISDAGVESLDHPIGLRVTGRRFREAGAAEDGFELVKPVQSEGVCIRQAKVFGAFGVFMAVGQVCDGKFDALKATFEKQFPEGSGTALESGQLFMGKSQTDVGMIYRGLATMPPKATVGARKVAFLCARRMGGTQ
jgi:hypothetical protein